MAVYTIRLNLGGDIIERLTKAEQLIDRIDSKAGRVRVRRRGRGVTTPAAAGEHVGGMRNFQNRQFFRNMFTPTGWRRNAGEMVGVAFDSAAAVLKAHPMLMAGAAIAGAAVLNRVIPDIIGGIGYSIGNKLLHSQNMTGAISNRMQLRMAEKGLGPQYGAAFQQATKIAAQYGYSRAGIMSTANTLSGLEVNGRQIDMPTAMRLASISGKVAQLGGRPYDIVAQNMLQIMSSVKPNMRDIRELLHAAPILSKFAIQDMKQQGVIGGDPREWLQDRGNLMQALNRLDTEFQAPAAAVARGNIALAKESAWMTISGQDRIWNAVSEAGVRLWNNIERAVTELSGEDISDMSRAMNQFADDVVTAGKILLQVANGLVSFVAGSSNLPQDNLRKAQNLKIPIDEFVKTAATQIAINSIVTNPELMAKYGKRDGGVELLAEYIAQTRRNEIINNAEVRLGPAGFAPPGGNTATGEYYSKTQALDNATLDAYGQLRAPLLSNAWFYKINKQASELSWLNIPARLLTPYFGRNYAGMGQARAVNRYSLDPAILADELQNKKLFTPDPNSDRREIEDLTKGSKSLTINFNAPIVSMPTTISGAQNPEAIMERVRQNIEDYTIRGIHIALNNATNTLK